MAKPPKSPSSSTSGGISDTCVRCGNPTTETPIDRRVSYFNRDNICLSCSERERSHPLFATAKAAEAAAVQAGDFKFPGIGCPPDLYLPAGNA